MESTTCNHGELKRASNVAEPPNFRMQAAAVRGHQSFPASLSLQSLVTHASRFRGFACMQVPDGGSSSHSSSRSWSTWSRHRHHCSSVQHTNKKLSKLTNPWSPSPRRHKHTRAPTMHIARAAVSSTSSVTIMMQIPLSSLPLLPARPLIWAGRDPRRARARLSSFYA